MPFKKSLLLIFALLFGTHIFFQNSEGLIQKILEVRQSYLIEKLNSESTFTYSKKEYLALKNTKEIIVNNKYYDIKKVVVLDNCVKLNVIEDKNENFIKYLTYSLKKEKSKKTKAKLKRITTLVIQNTEESKNNIILLEQLKDNFYLKQNKYFNLIFPLLKPPIV